MHLFHLHGGDCKAVKMCGIYHEQNVAIHCERLSQHVSAGAPCKEMKFPVRDVAMIVCLLFAMIVTIECNYMYVCC